MFTGFFSNFVCFSESLNFKNQRETLYSSKGKIVYVVGKPCNIYRLRGNPIVIIASTPQFVNTVDSPNSKRLNSKQSLIPIVL